jgi:hypothetical protein
MTFFILCFIFPFEIWDNMKNDLNNYHDFINFKIHINQFYLD